jgi:hypothetical protein
MNIVEAILSDKNKYIIFISGYLWWNILDYVVKALSNNLNFEIIYINQLIPLNTLITSADVINFPIANEIMKQKLYENKSNRKSSGYIVVSYTFPPEKIDFYPDIHINISADATLITSLIIELAKNKQIPRMQIDEHLSYLSKSWKGNKINKSIVLSSNYETKINEIYGLIFDTIMDNIMKKVYGEKYEDYKSNGKINGSTKNVTFSNVSDPTKLSLSDIKAINSGIKNSQFTNDLDDVIIDETDSELDSELKIDSKSKKSNDVFIENIDENVENEINYSIQSMSNLVELVPKRSLTNEMDSEKSINSIMSEMDAGFSQAFYIGRRNI